MVRAFLIFTERATHAKSKKNHWTTLRKPQLLSNIIHVTDFTSKTESHSSAKLSQDITHKLQRMATIREPQLLTGNRISDKLSIIFLNFHDFVVTFYFSF